MLYNIQFLRAIAAIIVLLHHTLPQYQAMGGTSLWFTYFCSWGFIGVDIFFIISGYIMAYTTINKQRTFTQAKQFLTHRFFRIYLGYIPFFIAMFTLLLKINPEKLATLDIFGSLFLINTDMYQLVLPISWSLSYELFFYILFVFTFFFSKKALYNIIPLFIFSLFLLSFLSYYHIIPLSFFYSPFLLEFFAGILLYMYQKYFMKPWILLFATIIMGVSLYLGIFYETKNGLIRIFTFGSSMFSLILIFLILEHNKLYKTSTLFKKIGDASYTIYLSHLIIIELFYFIGARDFFTTKTLPLLGVVVIFISVILFSLFYYKWIEKPLYQRVIS